jgi:RNA polymerase sigma-70 factor (ECF subfamily)
VNQLPATRHSLLIRLADARDGVAWNEFLEVYEQAIFRFACSRGLQPADAEDVTQRVLAAVVEKMPSWEAGPVKGRFGAWLFHVTRNLAAKTWNDRAYGPVTTGGSDAVIDLAEIPEQEQTLFETEWRKALFHWAAERVRHQIQASTWQAFWATAVECRAATVVANELSMSVASVYAAKCRTLARIRDEIEAFEGEFALAPNEKSR